MLLSLLVQLPAALALAMLLNQPLRGRAAYRLIFFAPYVLSEVTTAVLFDLVFSPNRGLGNSIATWLGADAGAVFADPDTVLYAVFMVVSWKYFGLYMMLFLAARQGIPRSCPRPRSPTAPPPGRRSGTSPCPARADDPDQRVPVGHRHHPTVRHGLGAHPRRPDPLLGDHGRDNVRVRLPPVRGRLRQRDQHHHVPAQPRLRPLLPAHRPAA
ncbi:sugar ABC transporter permease [Micromonospora sp. M12]